MEERVRCCYNCADNSYAYIPGEGEELVCSSGYTEYTVQPDDVCEEHNYDASMINTYALYDDKYLGLGIFIISELGDDIIKFAKIYTSDNIFPPHFYVRAYERESVDKPNQAFRAIEFNFDNSEKIHEAIENLVIYLGKGSIKSIDPSMQGENQLTALWTHFRSNLTFLKDVYGVEHATDFIDINIGDNMSCEHYNAIHNFYCGLMLDVAIRETDENDIQKILKLPNYTKRS